MSVTAYGETSFQQIIAEMLLAEVDALDTFYGQ